MARSTLLLLLLATACKNEGTVGTIEGGKSTDDAAPTWELVLTLSSTSATAGDHVGYGLVMVSTAGETEEVSGAVTSDIESDLHINATEVWPTVAGVHTLSATADYGEEPYTATATLDVAAGAPTTLDLALSDRAFLAGDSITYDVAAWDTWGNAADTTGADEWVDSTEVDMSGGVISSTLPGTYVATASLGDVSDSEVFAVYPGEAESVDLELSDIDLEVYETTSALVTVLDAWGNDTGDPWTLSVSGTGLTVISNRNVTFYEEGIYTVRVDVDGTTLYDEVGPLTIDSTGPELTIDEPDRGDWVYGDAGTVSGSVNDEWSGVASVTVDGDAVGVESDGSFSTEESYDFGMNVVETSATDTDGNVSTDTRALLAGDFEPYGDGISGGLLARLHEGDGGLGELESMGVGLVSAADLSALIPSPVYDYEEETCTTVLWWEVCVTWYSITLYVTNPTIGSSSMSLDPKSTGLLDADLEVDDVSLDWSGSGTVLGIGYSGSGDITADWLNVAMELDPYVSSNQIYVDVDSVDVTSGGFDFDFDSWLWDVIDYLGIPVDSWIEGYVESAMEDAVQSSVPDVISAALQDLEIGYSFDVGDQTYDMDALPDDIDVDETGITLSLETYFTADSWTISRTGEGSLYQGYSQPVWTGSPGTILGLSGDFLNQVFLAFWGGGLLDMTMTADDLGLDVNDLAVFLPTLTDLTVTTEALLPPVVVPGTGSSLLDMQVGDLKLTLYNGPAESGYEMIEVYVSAIVGLDLSATSDATLSASLGDMDLYFDVVYPDAGSMGAADTEALLEALVPLLLPSLTDALGEVPIPDISGYTLTNISVGLDGAEDGYVTLGGDISK